MGVERKTSGHWICLGGFLALTGLSVWTWWELQRWLARSDVLTPFLSMGLSRLMNRILFTGCALLLFFLLGLYGIYRTCREDSRPLDVAAKTPVHRKPLESDACHDGIHLRGAWTR